jgi:hypothetical protein
MNKAKNSYYGQRSAAKRRNILFQLTFDEWYNWWLSNGVDKALQQSSRSANTLCMCRYGDLGPYSLTNIYCTTIQQNAADLWSNGRGIKISNAVQNLARFNAVKSNSKKIQTPVGIFNSRRLAIQHYNITVGIMKCWLRTKPTEFYYL